MKRNFFAIAALAVLFTACMKTEAVTKSDAPMKTEANESSSISNAKLTFGSIDFAAPNVFPEGFVYDPFDDIFLVSSISKGTIGSVTRDGIYSCFIIDGDLASTAGMEIDRSSKRLLVTSSTASGTVAKLAAYDLNTKKRLFLADLKALANDAGLHLANDVAIDEQGNAYVTDSFSGIIYKVDRNGNATIFYRNDDFTPSPGGFGFNGIEYSSSKGGYLLVGHTALAKVIKMPIDNPKAITTVKFTPAIFSPDGLLISKDSKELMVVNNTAGGPGSNVVSYKTTDSWGTATAIAPAFDTPPVYPTSLTSDGKTEYVLYSYLHRLLFNNPPLPQEIFTIQSLPFNSTSPF